MSDEVTFDKPVEKKRKPAKKAKSRTAAPRAARPAEPFPGLTRTVCATACNEKACVISGKPYCAHPTKGGLRGDDMGDPGAKNRIAQARDQIDVRLDPDRFK